MAIIQSCCCWKGLRKGCFASALYSGFYYMISLCLLGIFVEQEVRFLSGSTRYGLIDNILEPEHISYSSLYLNIVHMSFGFVGLVACPMLIFATYKNQKYMLLPWLGTACLETIIHMTSLLKSIYDQTMAFSPFSTSLYTIDIFGIGIFIYAILCVTSQFQEYMAGRGRAEDYVERFVVHYSPGVFHTTSSMPSDRRRSTPRPLPSRYDPEDFLESLEPVPMRPGRGHVAFMRRQSQFHEEHSCCIHEAIEPSPGPSQEIPGSDSLWTETRPLELPAPEPRRRSSEHYYRPMTRARAAQRKMSMAATLPSVPNPETTV